MELAEHHVHGVESRMNLFSDLKVEEKSADGFNKKEETKNTFAPNLRFVAAKLPFASVLTIFPNAKINDVLNIRHVVAQSSRHGCSGTQQW